MPTLTTQITRFDWEKRTCQDITGLTFHLPVNEELTVFFDALEAKQTAAPVTVSFTVSEPTSDETMTLPVINLAALDQASSIKRIVKRISPIA
jgi:hypothetical protein